MSNKSVSVMLRTTASSILFLDIVSDLNYAYIEYMSTASPVTKFFNTYTYASSTNGYWYLGFSQSANQNDLTLFRSLIFQSYVYYGYSNPFRLRSYYACGLSSSFHGQIPVSMETNTR